MLLLIREIYRGGSAAGEQRATNRSSQSRLLLSPLLSSLFWLRIFFVFKVSVCKRPAWLEIVAAISAKSITKAHCRSVIRSFWLAGVFLPPQICKIFLYSEFPEFPVTLKRLCHSLLGMDPEQKLPTEETQEDGLNQQVRLVTLTGQFLAHIFSQLFRSVI